MLDVRFTDGEIWNVSIERSLKTNSIAELVLCDWDGRVHLLQNILERLPLVERDMFTTGRYTNENGSTIPCIFLSPSSEY